MKILWVTPYFMYPLHFGRNIRSFKILENLNAVHDITLVSFTREQDKKYFDVMKTVARRFVPVDFEEQAKDSIGFYLDVLKNMFFSLPYVIEKYRSAAMRSVIDDLVKQEKFDLLVCDTLAPCINIESNTGVPKIVFQHNVESMIWQRMYKKTADPVKRLIFFLQYIKLEKYEKKTLQGYNSSFAVSNEDGEFFKKEYMVKDVRIIPTGVDTQYFHRSEEGPESETLIFVGSMNWLPNIDGMSFFIKEVLPLIKEKCPSVKLYIVGHAPKKELYNLAQAHKEIVVTGTVDDVREYMKKASVYIVPLRVGGGTRIKIYEAMSMGKAVVATSIGAEGLPVTHNENIIIADDKQQIADAVAELIKDPQLRERIGTQARNYVEANCGWDKIAKIFSDQCEAVVRQEKQQQ